MPAKHLEANVRQEPGVAVIDLSGEINGFAQEALDAAYAEGETRTKSCSTSRASITSTVPASP